MQILNSILKNIKEDAPVQEIRRGLRPTTPLSEVLFKYGIDVLAGSVVTEKDVVLRSVSEGTTFMQLKMKGGIRFVTIIKDYDNIVQKLAG